MHVPAGWWPGGSCAPSVVRGTLAGTARQTGTDIDTDGCIQARWWEDIEGDIISGHVQCPRGGTLREVSDGRESGERENEDGSMSGMQGSRGTMLGTAADARSRSEIASVMGINGSTRMKSSDLHGKTRFRIRGNDTRGHCSRTRKAMTSTSPCTSTKVCPDTILAQAQEPVRKRAGQRRPGTSPRRGDTLKTVGQTPSGRVPRKVAHAGSGGISVRSGGQDLPEGGMTASGFRGRVGLPGLEFPPAHPRSEILGTGKEGGACRIAGPGAS